VSITVGGSYRERGRRAAADIGGARFVAGPAVLAGALHTERVRGQRLVGDRAVRHIA
jgi:hypothetical protein